MKKTNILVIGRHPQIMQTVLRLINSQPLYTAKGAIADGEAVDKFNTESFDLVLIGGGVEEGSEQLFKSEFTKLNPAIRIIRHYGGGSGLLFNEIEEAINSI